VKPAVRAEPTALSLLVLTGTVKRLDQALAGSRNRRERHGDDLLCNASEWASFRAPRPGRDDTPADRPSREPGQRPGPLPLNEVNQSPRPVIGDKLALDPGLSRPAFVLAHVRVVRLLSWPRLTEGQRPRREFRP
jgi:hypothetical protein